ncbi:MAG: STAS domain-containing protein [Chloroflexota bacterium]
MSLEIQPFEHNIRIMAITLKGRLDAFEAPALRAMCDEYISADIIHFVFDLSDVTMLDSAGLAVLVSVLKRARLKTGDVRLVWPKAEVASRILKLTRFDQVFTSIGPSEIIPRGF